MYSYVLTSQITAHFLHESYIHTASISEVFDLIYYILINNFLLEVSSISLGKALTKSLLT